MSIDIVSSILAQAVNVIINASLPSIGIGLLIGLLIALFQAVTQIQEQTLTFVPKMIAVFMVIVFTFPWMANLVLDLTLMLWRNIPFYALR